MFVDSIGAHFVSNPTAVYFTQDSLDEWLLTGTYLPSDKANRLGAAIADIMLWGATMLDQVIQVLVAPAQP